MVKSAKFQMTIHIDNDREENKIQFLMASQTKMIRTLVVFHFDFLAQISIFDSFRTIKNE